jgi:hypothetical protein
MKCGKKNTPTKMSSLTFCKHRNRVTLKWSTNWSIKMPNDLYNSNKWALNGRNLVNNKANVVNPKKKWMRGMWTAMLLVLSIPSIRC